MAEKHMSRRLFMQTTGALGAFAMAGSFAAYEASHLKPAYAEEPNKPEMGPPNEEVEWTKGPGPFAFYYDQNRCIGCKNCAKACHEYKQLPDSFVYRRVYSKEPEKPVWELDETDLFPIGSRTADFLSISCNHCDKPACALACPTTAMHIKEDNGLVLVDKSKCIGCGYCYLACPYDAPRIDAGGTNTSRKCNMCEERIVNDELPMCVYSCPVSALDWGTDEEILQRHPEATIADAEPMPDASYTLPHFFMKKVDLGDNASLASKQAAKKGSAE
ncbi:MAG: 4Fe-4S dicluster domain-containing protein [Coriobacteriia bacterium]|nr:4Fe-4S dicluster domain-containing protein [Coriobacteriia bacterium]